MDRSWRRLATAGAVLFVIAAAGPPRWLQPSGDVRYGTGAAIVLAAVACAAAWMFSGQVALGHWGIAALGATVAHAAPGPLALRVAVGVVAGAGAGLVLAAIDRRRGGLATAVAGLAIAVAAPYWLLRAGSPSLELDAGLTASFAGAVAAAATVAMTWLRSSPLGTRMTAARDEPRRAAALGIAVRNMHAVGTAVSGALAGLAGVAYLAAVPAGLAPGAFDPARSLDVLAFAVVGGLGSAVGAGAGAAMLVAAGVVLPAPWGTLATGAGVVWVVLFAPRGLGGYVAAARDAVARAVRPEAFGRPPAPVVVDPLDGPADAGGRDDAVAIVAGADTRDALATPTVRATMSAAFFTAAPATAALFAAPAVLRDHAGIDLGVLSPWTVLAVAAASAAAAVLRWQRPEATAAVVPGEALAAGGFAVAAAAFVATSDELMVSFLVVVAPVVAGWALAGTARRAADAVVPRTRAAAAGVTVAAAAFGSVGAVHLATVAAGNTLLDAARWGALYLAAASIAATASAARAPADRARARHRAATSPYPPARRRWAPLRVDNLTVHFGPHRVLHDISFRVEPGQVVALVGGNGAGKSTLLRTVAGFAPPTTGRVDAAGEEVTALRPDERAAAGVAFVSGTRPIFPDLTVRENLRVGAHLTHRTRRSFDAALTDVLLLVPLLAHRLDTRAGVLSGGEQRQLAIAQTLFRRPVVLLVDELTLGLDAHAQATVLGLLRTLADDGIAIVVVDHDIEAVTAVADRVLAVAEGSVTEFDDIEAFGDERRELLPARFLARAPR